MERGICHNDRTVPIIMTGCTAHARNTHTSTSGLKSDVNIVFLERFPITCENFADLRTFKADIGLISYLHGLSGLLDLKWGGLAGKIGEGLVRY